MDSTRMIGGRGALAICLAAALLSRAAAADTPSRTSNDTGSNAWYSNATFSYDGAVVGNLHGGVARQTTYLGNLHLRDLIDLERVWGWTDSRLFFDAVWIHGGQPDVAVGDALGVDNLAGAPAFQPDELWLEKNFGGDRLSALVGLYDLNSEFYRLQSSGLFVNGAFGVGPEFAQSGAEGPSTFPRTSLGVRIAYKPTSSVVVRAAVFDGMPLIRGENRYGFFESGDGLLYLGEVAILTRPADTMTAKPRMRIGRNADLPPYEGKFAVGAWHYSTAFDRIDSASQPGRQHNSSGFYAIGDRVVARSAGDANRTLSLFAEAGFANEEVNRFVRFLGLGMVASGPFASRDQDELGIAIATARNGSPYLRSNASSVPFRSETAIELTYLAHVSSWLAMQPDLQYVIHPDTTRSTANALVFSLRFEISMGGN